MHDIGYRAAATNSRYHAVLALGDTLGGRPRDPALYRDGVADYERMATTPQFRAGLFANPAALLFP